MSIKDLLLQEIEFNPDTILAETLDFLRFLKTKETQTQLLPEVAESTEPTTDASINSTGRSLLEHLKTIGQWSGDDLQECVELVYATRSKAKFNDDNLFE